MPPSWPQMCLSPLSGGWGSCDALSCAGKMIPTEGKSAEWCKQRGRTRGGGRAVERGVTSVGGVGWIECITSGGVGASLASSGMNPVNPPAATIRPISH